MITLDSLTKVYGSKRAVDHLSVDVAPGAVTGFLGPNGAGKSTTMRVLLGLDRASSGSARINGRNYQELTHPLRTVGALLDPRSGHPGQSARQHLLGMARSNGISSARVPQVLETVGLQDVARSRIGTFSLGMRQRLGIASALLGDPDVLIFDEPVNGLDPEGVTWVRTLMRTLAAEGRTVFVSSHLLSEMAETADHLVVISRGRLVADAPLDDLLEATRTATVRSPDAAELARVLTRADLTVVATGQVLSVTGEGLDRIGQLAHGHGAQLDELSFAGDSLETVYERLTADTAEYRGTNPRTTPAAAPGSTPTEASL
ncbi:ABC transporter ATP-binding protein [Ruania zhangjianzhongii]|uniref:ABC transporter ATP-binding protein n=1 Tax=Ruania zhangjianzhongii TaxID=2603206 RepID=UPI0011CC9BF5|nr:ATP-binding cassette domain-containing protein [Ruania zhangjianzhongii]